MRFGYLDEGGFVLSTTENAGLPAWLVAACLLLALACVDETRAAEFAITSATWDADDQKLVVQGTGTITDTDANLDTITWPLPGGTPNDASAQNPGDVIYNNAGVFTATLVATNTDGETCVHQTRTITVDEQQGQILDPVSQEDNTGNQIGFSVCMPLFFGLMDLLTLYRRV
jgi:hypothetical protein